MSARPINGHKSPKKGYIAHLERELGMTRLTLAVAIERLGGELRVTHAQMDAIRRPGMTVHVSHLEGQKVFTLRFEKPEEPPAP